MLKSLFSRLKPTKDQQQLVMDALAQYRSDVFPAGLLVVARELDVSISEQSITINFVLPFPCELALTALATHLSNQFELAIDIKPTYQIKAVRQHTISGVTNIIAVASGKGGVGKSTTAVNLAYALVAEGVRVGILDADIYGPSVPLMLGIESEQPTSSDGKLLNPLQANGLSAMSIGFLMGEANATIWRGPMASSAFSQMLNETLWPELDYLIVDLPPGTGDIQLTLAQKVPVAGAVVVTTPQDISLIDAKKGMAMFDQVSVPVLGLIENMSFHTCENCGHQSHIFGENGGESLAKAAAVPMLGKLPLSINIQQQVDNGHCTVLTDSASDIAINYRKIAQNMVAELFYNLDMNSPMTADFDITEE